jgi:hypothetical protein
MMKGVFDLELVFSFQTYLSLDAVNWAPFYCAMPEIDVGRHLDMFPLAGYMLGIDEKGC